METATATAPTSTKTLVGAYLVNGTMGNLGMPGAPIMHVSLIVVPNAHSVTGTVTITQALAPPNGEIIVRNVTGVIRKTGLGKVTQIVALEGEYTVSVPPPAIGTYLAKFSAHMAIDNNWEGRGGFSYGNNHIEDVPVTKN